MDKWQKNSKTRTVIDISQTGDYNKKQKIISAGCRLGSIDSMLFAVVSLVAVGIKNFFLGKLCFDIFYIPQWVFVERKNFNYIYLFSPAYILRYYSSRIQEN